MTALTDINGIGPALAKRLEAAGIVDCTALAAADPTTLTSIPGVTDARLAAWRQALAQMGLTTTSNPVPAAATDAETGAAEASSPAADVVVMLPTAALPLEDELTPAEDQTPKKTKAKKGKGQAKAKDKPKTKKKKSKTADASKKKKKKDTKAKKKKAGKKASEAKTKKTKAKGKKKKNKAA